MTSRSAISPWYSHGWRRTAPIARIAASPGFRIGVPASMPNTPMFVIEIVPPAEVGGLVRPGARRLGERGDRVGELDERHRARRP